MNEEAIEWIVPASDERSDAEYFDTEYFLDDDAENEYDREEDYWFWSGSGE